jgi:hypothetical protein
VEKTLRALKKKSEKNTHAGGVTACEFATKILWRWSSLQTSGAILGRADDDCQDNL